MHDCNPISEAAATSAKSIEDTIKMTIPGWTGQWNGDVWKTIVHLRSYSNNLKIFVIDCDYGLGVIKFGTPASKLNLKPEEIKNLTYHDLLKNRKYFLNLKMLSYVPRFLKTLK